MSQTANHKATVTFTWEFGLMAVDVADANANAWERARRRIELMDQARLVGMEIEDITVVEDP